MFLFNYIVLIGIYCNFINKFLVFIIGFDVYILSVNFRIFYDYFNVLCYFL